MRALRFVLAAFVIALAGSPPAATGEPASLAGQLLVAESGMPDPRFAGTVIFLVRHDATGAFGLIVNRRLGVESVATVMKTLGLDPGQAKGEMAIHAGGPVEPTLGFVLHTTDYARSSTLTVSEAIALTAEPDVLGDIASGQGPRRSLFALGYAGWGPGQLEGELQLHAWFVVPADLEVIFDDAVDTKWNRASARRGIDL